MEASARAAHCVRLRHAPSDRRIGLSSWTDLAAVLELVSEGLNGSALLDNCIAITMSQT